EGGGLVNQRGLCITGGVSSPPPKRRFCGHPLPVFLQRPAGRAAPTAIAPPSARWCQRGRQRHSQRASAPVSLDSFPAPSRCAMRLAARRRPPSDGEIVGGAGSFLTPPPTLPSPPP